MRIALLQILYMEKILIAINVSQYNAGVIDFGCFLASLTRSKVTGIFLEDLQEDEVPSRKSLFGNPYIESIVADDIIENRNRIKLSESCIRLFENTCTNKGVSYKILREKGTPEDAIISESRFADLLILDAEMSFEEEKEPTPTGFVRQLLPKLECPAVIAPFNFYGVEEVLLAYDGGPSSVFAIKQFNYLFPQFSGRKLTVLQVDENEDIPIIDKQKITELLEPHYSLIDFQVLHGKAADEIFGYLIEKKNVFVVMGAFSHKLLHGIFRHSTAELILKAVNLPVFIAHH
jgi:hypothetical protein